jgi:hypothetical protein
MHPKSGSSETEGNKHGNLLENHINNISKEQTTMIVEDANARLHGRLN